MVYCTLFGIGVQATNTDARSKSTTSQIQAIQRRALELKLYVIYAFVNFSVQSLSVPVASSPLAWLLFGLRF